MIHFFVTFSGNVDESPLAAKMRDLKISHRLFPAKVTLRYKSRLWLVAIGWPSIFFHAIVSAVKSLFFSQPKPSTIVVGSHIEAYVFGLLRLFKRDRKNPKIVLLGFIFTSRKSPISKIARELYFKTLFSFAVDKAICHSRVEVERYTKIFPSSNCKFIYMPCGLFVPEALNAEKEPEQNKQYILSAGRSGRDYLSLCKAIEGLPIDLHIICDNEAALAGVSERENVKILRDCYDDNYFFELKNSYFVVVPLAVNDISAGQMVIIQAMAYGKATVVTSTPTIHEYVTNGEQSILVEQSSIEDIRVALQKLLVDESMITRLGANARETYKRKFSIEAYTENLINCIKK